jgi:hypothetical protein
MAVLNILYLFFIYGCKGQSYHFARQSLIVGKLTGNIAVNRERLWKEASGKYVYGALYSAIN